MFSLERYALDTSSPDCDAEGTLSGLLVRRFPLRLLDGELILNAKRSRHLARAQAGEGLVALGVYHAEERDPAVLHDDVDRVVAARLHTGEPHRTHRVKPCAERVPVAPQQASARRVS